jgi:hypothetical protein
MPRLMTMFKESAADDWIRQPVASYVLVAAEQPNEVGERGKAAVAELEKLDKETVERARSLSAFSFLAQAASAKPAAVPATGATPEVSSAAATPSAKTAAPATAADPTTASAPVATAEPASTAATEAAIAFTGGAEAQPVQPATSATTTADATATPPAKSPTAALAATAEQRPAAPAAAQRAAGATGERTHFPLAAENLPAPSRLKIIGVPLLAALVMLVIIAVLLRGTDPRSSQEST